MNSIQAFVRAFDAAKVHSPCRTEFSSLSPIDYVPMQTVT